MQTITFEISDQFQGILASRGIQTEVEARQLTQQLLADYMDDAMLIEEALDAKSEGYIGVEKSRNALQDMLNARD